MIVGYSAASNVWVRSSICWAIAFLILTFDLVVIDDFGAVRIPVAVESGIVISAAGAIILWTIGKKCGECNRVVMYVFIFGLLGVLPMLAAFLLTCSLALLFLDVKIYYPILMAVVVILLLWVIVVKRIVDNGSIVEGALKSRGKFLLISRLHVFLLFDGWRLPGVRLRADICFLASAGVFLSYALQHELRVRIGDEAVFFCISLVGSPYAFSCLLRFIGGFYIWIYAVVRVERNFGKRVVFHSSQMSLLMEQRKEMSRSMR